MTDREVIEYWTHKINVEQKEYLDSLISQRIKDILEHNRTHKLQVSLSLAYDIPEEVNLESKIPIHDYEILQKNKVQLCGIWSCVSGKDAYARQRKVTNICEDDYFAIGTPFEGYYKIINVDNPNDKITCYYSTVSTNEFVTEEIEIKLHQLFNPNSNGNRCKLTKGDILHVKSLKLVNKRYAVEWEVIS